MRFVADENVDWPIIERLRADGHGELVYRQQQLFTGLILVRLAGVAPQAKAQLVTDTIAQFGESLIGAFTVITSTSVRHRPRRTL